MKTKRNYKSIESLKGKVRQLNLYHLISCNIPHIDAGWININNLLTNNHINQIADLLGGRTSTKQHIKTVLKNQTFSAWYLERIIYSFDRNKFEYVAAQDYPYELKEIRKNLLNR